MARPLQWGRNLTVAEGPARPRPDIRSRLASMGPQLDSCGRRYRIRYAPQLRTLQWGRNLTVAEGIRGEFWRQYLSVLQWGRNLTVAEGLPKARPYLQLGIASMGPQLDSCGRCGADLSDVHGGRLQWGRNLTVAEGDILPPAGPPALAASMGPQLDSCGRGVRRYGRDPSDRASMGPQLDSCGRLEGGPPAQAASNALQWGRNLTVAEGPHGSRPTMQSKRFNGAAT